MDVKTFLLPDLGEGLQEAEIVSWKVSVGDSIVMDQLLMEVKTQKAIVEIPSPYTGTVKALHGKVGDVLGVGVLLVEFEVAESSDCDVSAPEKKMEPAYLPTPELEPKKVAEGGNTHCILSMPIFLYTSGFFLNSTTSPKRRIFSRFFFPSSVRTVGSKCASNGLRPYFRAI